MSQSMSLKEAERRAFVTYTFSDGIWDIVFGLQMLIWGLAPLLEEAIPLNDWWVAILAVPLMAFLVAAKWVIITPRLGLVRFGQKRKAKVQTLILFLVIALALAVVAGYFMFSAGPSPAFLRGLSLPVLVWAMLFLTGFGLAAYATSVPRLYVYGVVFALVYPLRVILRQATGTLVVSLLGYFVAAAILLTIGIVLLSKFLKQYPVQLEETALKGPANGGR